MAPVSAVTALRTPRSPGGKISGRPRWKRENICTVQGPPPLSANSSSMVGDGLLSNCSARARASSAAGLLVATRRAGVSGEALGAPRWKSHVSITVPLCIPGILSAFLICFTLCLSAFVIPMILGKGKVLFVSNLIYSRFSEIANYPSGSAIAIVMLFLSLVIIYSINNVVSRYYKA